MGGINIKSNLRQNTAPFMQSGDSTRSIYIDVTLALLSLYVIAYYYYGPRVLVTGALTVAAAAAADLACTLISKKPVRLRDMSAIITGLILPLLMPAAISYYVPVICALFAILVAKAPFGGTGSNIFNPAATGFAFAVICFPQAVFAYTKPLEHLGLSPVLTEVTAAVSPALTLGLGGIPQYDIMDIVLGNVPGPMGATNIILLLACLLYLVFRNTISWESPVFFLLTAALIAFWFPRSPLISNINSLIYELTSGIILFGAVFMVTDPVTSPKRDWAKIVYCVILGIIVMLFRHIGKYQEVFAFALLIVNMFAWNIDIAAEKWAKYVRKRARSN